jgi:hypothetical protein
MTSHAVPGIRPVFAHGRGSNTLLGLAGVLAPMKGHVELFGERTKAPLHRRARRGLALVPEQRSIFRRITAEANLKLGLGPVEDALGFAPVGETWNENFLELEGSAPTSWRDLITGKTVPSATERLALSAVLSDFPFAVLRKAAALCLAILEFRSDRSFGRPNGWRGNYQNVRDRHARFDGSVTNCRYQRRDSLGRAPGVVIVHRLEIVRA